MFSKWIEQNDYVPLKEKKSIHVYALHQQKQENNETKGKQENKHKTTNKT